MTAAEIRQRETDAANERAKVRGDAVLTLSYLLAPERASRISTAALMRAADVLGADYPGAVPGRPVTG